MPASITAIIPLIDRLKAAGKTLPASALADGYEANMSVLKIPMYIIGFISMNAGILFPFKELDYNLALIGVGVLIIVTSISLPQVTTAKLVRDARPDR